MNTKKYRDLELEEKTRRFCAFVCRDYDVPVPEIRVWKNYEDVFIQYVEGREDRKGTYWSGDKEGAEIHILREFVDLPTVVHELAHHLQHCGKEGGTIDREKIEEYYIENPNSDLDDFIAMRESRTREIGLKLFGEYISEWVEVFGHERVIVELE